MSEVIDNEVPQPVTTPIELEGKSAAEMRAELLSHQPLESQAQSAEQAELPIETEAAPIPGQPYQTKEGWQVDIDLEDGHGVQSFKAKTLKELIASMAQAQAHATRKINELHKQRKANLKPEPAKPIQKFEPKQLTNEEQWLIAQEFDTNPSVAYTKLTQALFGASPDEVREAMNTVRQMAAEQARQREALAFLKANPDYVNSTKNEKAMTEYLTKNNLAVTQQNLELAFVELSEAGNLENKTTTETASSDRESNRIVAPQTTRTRRASVGISTRQVSQTDDEEIEQDTPDVEELRKLSAAELRNRIVAEHHKKATYRVRR